MGHWCRLQSDYWFRADDDFWDVTGSVPFIRVFAKEIVWDRMYAKKLRALNEEGQRVLCAVCPVYALEAVQRAQRQPARAGPPGMQLQF